MMRTLLTVVLLIAMAPTWALTQTAPDRSTQSALDAIDAVGPASNRAVPDDHDDHDGHDHDSAHSGRDHGHDHDGEPGLTRHPHNTSIDWPTLVVFFFPALATAAAIGVSGSVVGAFVLLRDEALLALSLPQIVAIGAAVGLRTGLPSLPPGIVAVGVALLYLIYARQREARGGSRGVSLIPTLYIGGLCVSFLIVAHGGQHVEQLQNLFTGIDIAVAPAEAWVVVPILLLTAVIAAALWRRWLLLAQQRPAAELAGLRVAQWDGLFLSLLAIVTLLGTATQGPVLVLAMLFLPPAIAMPWARRVPGLLAISAGVSLVCLAGAFVVANLYSLPLSHSVGGIGVGLLVISQTLRRVPWFVARAA